MKLRGNKDGEVDNHTPDWVCDIAILAIRTTHSSNKATYPISLPMNPPRCDAEHDRGASILTPKIPDILPLCTRSCGLNFWVVFILSFSCDIFSTAFYKMKVSCFFMFLFYCWLQLVRWRYNIFIIMLLETCGSCKDAVQEVIVHSIFWAESCWDCWEKMAIILLQRHLTRVQELHLRLVKVPGLLLLGMNGWMIYCSIYKWWIVTI